MVSGPLFPSPLSEFQPNSQSTTSQPTIQSNLQSHPRRPQPPSRVTTLSTEELDPQALPWQRLVELGIPIQDAKGIVKSIAHYQTIQAASFVQRSLQARELMPIHWRKLIEVGMPINDARVVADGIAGFDASRKPLTGQQKKLICKYSALVCRAELWRSGMLLQE